jgi:hypothetical protein
MFPVMLISAGNLVAMSRMQLRKWRVGEPSIKLADHLNELG